MSTPTIKTQHTASYAQLYELLSVAATRINQLETRIAALEDAGDTSATITLDQWEE